MEEINHKENVSLRANNDRIFGDVSVQLASFCHSLSLGEADFCVAARPVDSLLQQERSADELIH